MSRTRAALALVALTACGEESTGTEYPCSLGADCPSPSIPVVELPEAALVGAMFEFCVDDACVSGAVPAPPLGEEQSTHASLSGGFQAGIRLERTATSIRVVVTFLPVTPPFDRVDGQIYVATLRDANGVILTARSWSAEYDGVGECPDTCSTRLTPL
jgi:hypothetical protein